MYIPNFIIVGHSQAPSKEFIAEKQIAGDYSAIEDAIMRQFANMERKNENTNQFKENQTQV